MDTVVNQTEHAPGYWERISHLPGAIDAKLPSFDKSLDAYFDQNFLEMTKVISAKLEAAGA